MRLLTPGGIPEALTHRFLPNRALRSVTEHRARAADPLVGRAVLMVDPGAWGVVRHEPLLVLPTHPGAM